MHTKVIMTDRLGTEQREDPTDSFYQEISSEKEREREKENDDAARLLLSSPFPADFPLKGG